LAIQGDQVLTLLVGVVTSAVVGWLVIDLLLAWIRRIGLGWFAYYRWVIAIVILVTWWMRTS
jgi:undecaprenyl pyrophosphate phosphatase UppP